MPTVPRTPGPQVAPQPIGGARIARDAPAGAFSEQIPTAANLAREVFADERARAMRAWQIKEDNALDAWELEAVHNPETGIVGLRGEAAAESSRIAAESLNTFALRRMEAMNDEQKSIYKAMVDARGTRVRGVAYDHTFAEVNQAEDDAIVAGKNTALSLAVADRSNAPEAVEKVRALADAESRKRGDKKETRDAYVKGEVSRVHAAVMMSAAKDEDFEMAENYYKMHSDEMTVQDAAAAKDLVDELSRRRAVQRETDNIFIDYNDRGLRSLGEYIALADSVKDPDVRNAVREEVARRYRLLKTAEQEDYEATLEQAHRAIDEGRNVDPVVWQSIDAGDRDRLMARRQAVESNAFLPADEYWRVREIVDTDPSAFLKMNLWLIRGSMPENRWWELKRLQDNGREGTDNQEFQAKLRESKYNNEIFETKLGLVLEDASTPSGRARNKRQEYILREALRDRILLYQARKGKVADDVIVSDMIDNLLVTVPSGTWSDTQTPYIFLTDDERAVAKTGLEKRLKKATKEAGRPISFSEFLSTEQGRIDEVIDRNVMRVALSRFERVRKRKPTSGEALDAYINELNTIFAGVER